MSGTKELDAKMYSDDVINFIAIIIMLSIMYANIFGDQHREIVHDQTHPRQTEKSIFPFQVKEPFAV